MVDTLRLPAMFEEGHRPHYLCSGAVVQLSLVLQDQTAQICPGHEVLEAQVLLVFTAKPHDVCKPHIHDVWVRLHTYRLSVAHGYIQRLRDKV